MRRETLAVILAFIVVFLFFCPAHGQETTQAVAINQHFAGAMVACDNKRDAGRLYREARKSFRYGSRMYLLLDTCRLAKGDFQILVSYRNNLAEARDGRKVPISLVLVRVNGKIFWGVPMNLTIKGVFDV